MASASRTRARSSRFMAGSSLGVLLACAFLALACEHKPRGIAALGAVEFWIDVDRGALTATAYSPKPSPDCLEVGSDLEGEVNSTRLTYISPGGDAPWGWLPGPGPRCTPLRAGGTVAGSGPATVVLRDATGELAAHFDDLLSPRGLKLVGPLKPGRRAMLQLTPETDTFTPSDGRGSTGILTIEFVPVGAKAPAWSVSTFEPERVVLDGGRIEVTNRSQFTVTGSTLSFVVPPRAQPGTGTLALRGQGADLVVYPAIRRCEGAVRCHATVTLPSKAAELTARISRP